MAEALFYHLERRTLDAVLPGLIERTLDRGWRAVIKAESSERADAIDNLLWTYNEQSFLPHAQAGDGNSRRQPVLITVEDENPNGAQVLFLVGGATPPSWTGKDVTGLARVVLVFEGRDPDALLRAREAWKASKEAGHEATYWKESVNGKFEKQA